MTLTLSVNETHSTLRESTGAVFLTFCLWAFVLLSRPQDVFPVLSPLRPALAAGILALLMYVLNFRTFSNPPFFQERQIKYFTAMLFIMILGIPLSLYARLSFMLIFTEYINVILFFYIFYKLVNSLNKLSVVLLICSLGTGVYSLYSVTTGEFGEGRLSFGSMFDSNDLAYFALGFLPLNLIFMSRDNPVWVRLACFASIFVEVLLLFKTGSRGGILAFGVAAVLLLFMSKNIRLPLKVVFVAMGFAIVSFSTINTDRLSTLTSITEDYNVQSETGRLAIWEIGLRGMFNNPLTGVGVGCFANYVGIDRQVRDLDSKKWQAAHNSLVQIGAETGLIGLALFVKMSWDVLAIFYKVNKGTLSGRLSAICEMGFVGFVGLFISGLFLSQAYSLYWAFYVVFSAVANQMYLREQAFARVQN